MLHFMGVRKVNRISKELESIKRIKAMLESLSEKWGFEIFSSNTDEEYDILFCLFFDVYFWKD